MRRILSLFQELRSAQLEKYQADASRIAESAHMFEWFDNALSGINRPGDPAEKLQEVMTSADFAAAFGDFVSRAMLPGYQKQGFQFERFVKPDTSPNFQPVTRKQRRSSLDRLEYVGEKGEARPGSVADATSQQWRPYKFEKQFDFSMEALVNDDLGYFDDTAQEMGQMARVTLEAYVSRFMWNAVTIARLIALGALYSTTGRLTTARVSTARMAFGQRTDGAGERIQAPMAFIVYHSGLKDTVLTIQQSELVPELATNAKNVVRNFEGIEDPYCAGAAPNLPWFALADYRGSGVIPFVLVRRQGVAGPWIGRKKSDIEFVSSLLGGGAQASAAWGDFATGNIVVKVHDEWGTYIDGTEGNMVNNLGCYYSNGTAA